MPNTQTKQFIKEFLTSLDFYDVIETISHQNQLSLDQQDILGDVVREVLLDKLTRNSLASEFMGRAKVSMDVAEKINQDVKVDIFDVIDELENAGETEEQSDETPSKINESTTSKNTTAVLSSVAKEENLHVDQAGQLHDAVSQVFSGDLHPNEFVPEIKNALNLSDEQASRIAKKLDEKVFAPAKEALRESHTRVQDDANIFDQNIEARSVLNAISNPTSIPTTSTVTQTTPKINVPKPLPPKVPTAPLPDMPQSIAKDFDQDAIHLKKMTDVTVSQTRSVEQNISVKKPLIPEDHIERIANDPYKENVI